MIYSSGNKNVTPLTFPYQLCVGTNSRYNYHPTQNILLDNQMIGDTITLFVETVFNTDLGERVEIKNEYKIIRLPL